jgi:LPS export ABC transporter protein LptC
MNRRKPTLVFFTLGAVASASLLSGCQGQKRPEPAAQPFVFRSLNLQQHNLLGQPTWNLSSPEARYDLGRRVAQARNLKGILFANGTARYRLSATSATVLNDGELIQLEGDLDIRRLGPKPLEIKAKRARWYPSQNLMVLDRHPVAIQDKLKMSSNQARFLIDQDKLELRDNPLLQRHDNGKINMKIRVSSADWYTKSGDLFANGPVRGVRKLTNKPQQVLTAPSLKGNTLNQILMFAEPVRLVDITRGAVFNARETQVDVRQETISSSLPFQGTVKQSTVRGIGFQLFYTEHLARVLNECKLKQPTDSLTANRCQWNWQTDEVQAIGNVVLKRQTNNQTTKSDRIDGRIGSEGLVVFTSPGKRVKTQMTLNQKPARAKSRETRSDLAAPPIQL